jgi:hypothetical protein
MDHGVPSFTTVRHGTMTGADGTFLNDSAVVAEDGTAAADRSRTVPLTPGGVTGGPKVATSC